MDQKEIELVTELHDKIIKRKCDEKDIYSLLIIIRSYADGKTAVREFGDFIAHREKDRGFISDYLIRTKGILDNLGNENTVMVIKPVFTFDEIKNSFNNTFKKIGLIAVSNDDIRILILFIISLLQDVSIVDKKRSVGKLLFSLTRDEIILLGRVWIQNKVHAVFPVLVTENRYEKSITSTDPQFLKKIVRVHFENGLIRIQPTQFDVV